MLRHQTRHVSDFDHPTTTAHHIANQQSLGPWASHVQYEMRQHQESLGHQWHTTCKASRPCRAARVPFFQGKWDDNHTKWAQDKQRIAATTTSNLLVINTKNGHRFCGKIQVLLVRCFKLTCLQTSQVNCDEPVDIHALLVDQKAIILCSYLHG